MIVRDGRDAALGSISKGTLGATNGVGCERDAYYREMVRWEDGTRLSFPANDRMAFGTVVDVLHQQVLEAHTGGNSFSQDEMRLLVQQAVAYVRDRESSLLIGEDHWADIEARALVAGLRLVGLMPNAAPRGKTASPFSGPPVAWPSQIGGDWMPQHKSRIPGVFGERGLSGMPDYTVWDGDRVVGWVDVKTVRSAIQYPGKWFSAETVVYDRLAMALNNGQPPEWHGYMEYRGGSGAYWAMTIAPVNVTATLRLAEAYIARWETALATYNPDAVSFNTTYCGNCSWRDGIPDAGFSGCEIGRAAHTIATGE